MSKTRTEWTIEQQEKLEALYPMHTAREIGELLGKTKAAIQMRAIKSGLKKPADFKYKEPELAIQKKIARQLGKKRGPFSYEHRKKISDAQPTKGLGANKLHDRKCFEYKNWRIEVLKRDDYTCQNCSVRGGKLQVDQIKPYALFVELRHEVDNGRTLCVECHKQTETYSKRFDLMLLKQSLEELRLTYGGAF